MKKILICIFLLLMINPVIITAAEIDIGKNGTINIYYKYAAKNISNSEIKLYRVCAIDTNGKYTYLDNYSLDDSLDIDTIVEWNDLANKISNYIENNNIEYLKKCITDKNGKCNFSGLETGLYLVTSSEVIEGNHIYRSAPTFIFIPTHNELEDNYIYDLDIILKAEMKTINVDNSFNKGESKIESVVPKTVDNVFIYLMIFGISIIVIISVVLYMKKIKKKEKSDEKNN